MTKETLRKALDLNKDLCSRIENTDPGYGFSEFLNIIDNITDVDWNEWYEDGMDELEGNYIFDHMDQIWAYGAFVNKYGDDIPDEYLEIAKDYFCELNPEFLRATDIYENVIDNTYYL